MSSSEIPLHIVDPWITDKAKRLKTLAPQIIFRAIDGLGLAVDSGKVVTLNSGEISASYYLKSRGRPFIVKLKTEGAVEEAETLKAWRNGGVNVPEVTGVYLANDISDGFSVQALAMEAILDEAGKPAPLGYQFIDADVARASSIGSLMGQELSKAHKVKTEQVSISWESFLRQLLIQHEDYLYSKGITTKEMEAVSERLSGINLQDISTYIHGDFGVHNVLVSERITRSVYIIDPDPLIGDPYMDIAAIVFRLEMSRRMYESNPENREISYQYEKFMRCYEALLAAYFANTNESIDYSRLSVNKLTLLPKMRNRENKLRVWIAERKGDVQALKEEINAYSPFLMDFFRTIIEAAD